MKSSSSRLVFVGVAGLLALHFFLAVWSKAHESVTSDELAHLAGGVSYWHYDDYRYQPENGNLPQRWAAIPAVIMRKSYPDPKKDEGVWETSDVWVYGHRLFYESGEDHFPQLMAGRAMIALFSVATGLMIFLWSRRLFGTAGAFVSLGFFTFYPAFLANGALVTSDACMAFFMLATVALWWKHLHDGRRRYLILSALCFGLACVAKFSAVLLIPMMLILAAVRIATPEPITLLGGRGVGRVAKSLRILGSIAVHAVTAIFIIWAFFGFRYSGFNPALPTGIQYLRDFTVVQGEIGPQGKILHLLAQVHALPEAYLYGYGFVIDMSAQRAEFMDGLYSIHGWYSFFPRAFLYKTTLPCLAACLLGATVIFGRWKEGTPARWRRDLYVVAPLVVLFTVYWIVSIFSHLNIGERHLLPTYPILLIALGSLGSVLMGRKFLTAGCVAVLLLWHAGEAIAIAPHYLAYFNEGSGGPGDGYRHLADSSVDWGQDLPGLADWLKAHRQPGETAYLSYFGTATPEYYGIVAEHLPFMNGFHQPDPYQPLGAGVYCVGATMLDQVYSDGRGAWTADLEKDYERLRTSIPFLIAVPKDAEEKSKMDQLLSSEAREHARKRFLALRFARLCFYLRARKPDADVGYSIKVYRLNAKEVHDAVDGSWREWADLIAAAPGN